MKSLEEQVGGSHYKTQKIQVVEYCHSNGIPFMEGSAIKYLSRWREKGGIADLKKAKHFIEMLIELECKGGKNNIIDLMDKYPNKTVNELKDKK